MGGGEQQQPRAKPAFTAPPPSALLGRLQAFLPAMQAANASLGEAPEETIVLQRGDEAEEEEGGGEGARCGVCLFCCGKIASARRGRLACG